MQAPLCLRRFTAIRYCEPRLLAALLLLLGVSPSLLRAQFQQPTDHELKMTADPKAPGAAAIYLYREETTDGSNRLDTRYDRIKVLTEKGKELATVRVLYAHGFEAVADIQGRTIHADGTVVPLTAKPADLMDVKTKGFQVNTVVFTLPSVEVGSILEYRLKIRLPEYFIAEPAWEIQQNYFISKAHYSFHPAVPLHGYLMNRQGQFLNRLMYSARLNPNAKVDYDAAKEQYSIDLADVSALPEEDSMPPINTLRWRVEFYYTSAASGSAFWVDAGKQWAKDVMEFSSPSAAIRSAAEGAISPSDTEEQKARKIYAAVMKLDNTDFSRKKSDAERRKEKLKEIKKADDVWKQQSGSADDIALLYAALARSVGLKVYPFQVVNRDRAMFDARVLSTQQLDNYLVVLLIDGKEIFLDPGQKMCPFGALHWKHSMASGFRLTDHGAVAVSTPAGTYKTALLQRRADLTLDPAGNIKGGARFVMTGPDALHWRQITLENDPDEVKRQFNEFIQSQLPDGVQADFDHFLGLDEYELNLIAFVNVTGNIGASTGKHFFLPGSFFEVRASHPFVSQDKRTAPVDVQYPRTQKDEVTYRLPSGFTLESQPQPANAIWPEYALLKINSTANDASVTVERTLVYNFTVLDPKDYGNLHDFYQKVATADQQQLVLTRANVAKGN